MSGDKRRRNQEQPDTESAKRRRVESGPSHRETRSPSRPRRTCRLCSNCIRKVKTIAAEKHILAIEIPVDVLYKPANCSRLSESQRTERNSRIRSEKQRLARELLKGACALRNSSGGIIIVHLVGLSTRDRYPGVFNEFVDDLLGRLIDDGTLFVDCFKKKWLDDDPRFSRFHDFISLTVSRYTNRISTANFMTKIPFDFKVEDPTPCNVWYLINSKKTFEDKNINIRGSNNRFKKLHENRCVQLKAFIPNDRGFLARNPRKLACYIWNDLKLKEYITSFSKLDKGGSYFLGTAEVEKLYKTSQYISRELYHGGIKLEKADKKKLKKLIFEKIASDIFGCDYNGKPLRLKPELLVNIEFHELQREGCFIVEVAVRAVEGLLFHGPKGPESYILDQETSTDEIRKVSFKDWFRLFTRTNSGI